MIWTDDEGITHVPRSELMECCERIARENLEEKYVEALEQINRMDASEATRKVMAKQVREMLEQVVEKNIRDARQTITDGRQRDESVH